MIVIITTTAVIVVGLLSSRFTTSEFRQYVTADDVARLDRATAMIDDYYRHAGSWAEVQPTLDRVGEMVDKRFALLDPQSNIVATSPAKLSTSRLKITPDHTITWQEEERIGNKVSVGEVILVGVPHRVIANSEGLPVGTLYGLPKMPAPGANSEARFVGSVNRSLIIAVAVAGLMALALTLLFSNRIVGPIESLTAAVQRLESGDLKQRVETNSKDEIGVLAKAFNSMSDKLVRTEELRRNMVSDIAHELRTPLTNIRCQLETLQDGLAKPEPAVIDSLHEEAMFLGRLVDDLQELALADAGQLNLSRQPVSINDEIAAAVNALQMVSSQRQITISFERGENLPTINVDARRIGQVLRNLISNAIAHTPEGGRVEVRSRLMASNIEISVQDNGEGIAQKHLSFIFERFYRTDASRNRKTGGAGLGLAIVKQLIIAHGGQIAVHSEPDLGSTFTFNLPIN